MKKKKKKLKSERERLIYRLKKQGYTCLSKRVSERLETYEP